MITINIDNERRAHKTPLSGVFICDNTDQKLQITVDANSGFDLTKTATAVFSSLRDIPQEVTFVGDIVTAPRFEKNDGRFVYVGIYQGDLHTSTPARVTLLESILSKSPFYSGSGEQIVVDEDEISDDDVIQINDVSVGAWIKTTIATFVAKIKSLIGIFSSENDGLVPAPTVDPISGEVNPHEVLCADGEWHLSEPELFWVYYDETTLEQIYNALDSGKLPVLLIQARDYRRCAYLESVDTDKFGNLMGATFKEAYVGRNGNMSWRYYACDDGDRWWNEELISDESEVLIVEYNSDMYDEIFDAIGNDKAVYVRHTYLDRGIFYTEYALLTTFIPGEEVIFTNHQSEFRLYWGKGHWEWEKNEITYEYLPLNVGDENAGKFVVVNGKGDIDFVEVSMWNGGDY